MISVFQRNQKSVWNHILHDLQHMHPDLIRQIEDQKAMETGARYSEGSGFIDLKIVDQLLEILRHPDLKTYRGTNDRQTVRGTRYKRGDRASRRIADYRLIEQQLLPARFESRKTSEKLDPALQGHLAALIERCQARLLRRRVKTEDFVNSIHWDYREKMESQLYALWQWKSSLSTKARWNLKALSVLGPSALKCRLRRVQESISYSGLLAEMASKLQSEKAYTTAPGFLYQRWCTLKMIQSLQIMGFELQTKSDDWLESLVMGGCLAFEGNSGHIQLWIEAILQKQYMHPSRVHCEVHRRSPDILCIFTPKTGAPRLIVFDATLHTDEVELRQKLSKYSDTLYLRNQFLSQPYRDYPALSLAFVPASMRSFGLLNTRGTQGFISLYPGQGLTGVLDEVLQGTRVV